MTESMTWEPGVWNRTPIGDHVYHQWIVRPNEPARPGPILARIERLGPTLWKPWIYPHGEDTGSGRPLDVVDWRRPTRTLWEAKDVAQREFRVQRWSIERG